jgi:UrcA family protein
MNRTLLIALGLLALSAPAVHAEPRKTLVMARVPIGDLDLTSRKDAAVMMRRLRAAAGQLCTFTPSETLRRERSRAEVCRRRAVRAAVQQLNAPELTVALAQTPER